MRILTILIGQQPYHQFAADQIIKLECRGYLAFLDFRPDFLSMSVHDPDVFSLSSVISRKFFA